VRHRKDLGARKHERIEYQRTGFIIPTWGPWRFPNSSEYRSRRAAPLCVCAVWLGAGVN
jgi:hypothetical protein